jgi:MFS family permease
MLGALRHRNYRLFLTGQIVSTVGTWMQSVAMPWLALQLTHNGFLVGLVLAAQFMPVLVGSQLGGVVADRYRKRSVLLVTQSLFMVPSFALFFVSAGGHAEYWMVVVAALATGTINLFDIPSRQAFLIEMVGRQDLMNAIALNSSVFNGAAVIGPAIAGLIIAAFGLPFCFLINGVSYLAAILALLLMRDLPALVRERDLQPWLTRIAQGASYARQEPVVGVLLVVVAVFSLFAMNRLTLIPLFADEVLHVGAQGFGFLLGAMGLGSLAGALILAFNPSASDPRRQFWMAMIWVVALFAFAFSRVFAISLIALFVAGYAQLSFVATANNRIQTITPDHLRGRVMALYAQALIGVGPIGSTQAGALATLFGDPTWAMAIGALIAGAVVLGVRLARPYVFAPSSAEVITRPASPGITG